MRILVPALALSATLQLHAVDWPQYRGPSGDGKSPEKISVPAGNVAPKQVWKIPSDSGFSSFDQDSDTISRYQHLYRVWRPIKRI